MAMQNTFDILRTLIEPEQGLADQLLQDYNAKLANRSGWEDEITEINDYLYATDTSTTTNSDLPFANTVTIPKLAQVYKIMTANYMRHLIPTTNWISWQGGDSETVSVDYRKNVESYVRSKIEHSGAEDVIESCIEDLMKTGICIARTRYVREVKDDGAGYSTVLYSGARTHRINPLNFVYDVTASDIKSAVKYVREVYSMGELARMVDEDANSFLTAEQLEGIRQRRINVRNIGAKMTRQDGLLSRRLVNAGFGDIMAYYQGSAIEVIQAYGDFYDMETGELLKNHRITIVDQKEIIQSIPLENVDGGDDIHVAIHECRDNSLAPLSPLARIIGMQHKLDKLENLRADIFDNISNPTMIEIGDVQFMGQRGTPGGRYVVEEGGDVRTVRYDSIALSADTQMMNTMVLMEELAGAPRESAGFRTPGEKTKFEVQLLDGASNNIFLRKVRAIERQFLEPILSSYLELGRRYLDVGDLIKVMDNEAGIVSFVNISRDMLTGQGRMVPRGASILADKANALQTLTTLANTNIMNSLAPHVSKKRLARAVEELAGLSEFHLFTPNIGMQEDMETQRLAEQEKQRSIAAQAQDSSVTLPNEEDIEASMDGGDEE